MVIGLRTLGDDDINEIIDRRSININRVSLWREKTASKQNSIAIVLFHCFFYSAYYTTVKKRGRDITYSD